jgi:hypothetical protein
MHTRGSTGDLAQQYGFLLVDKIGELVAGIVLHKNAVAVIIQSILADAKALGHRVGALLQRIGELFVKTRSIEGRSDVPDGKIGIGDHDRLTAGQRLVVTIVGNSYLQVVPAGIAHRIAVTAFQQQAVGMQGVMEGIGARFGNHQAFGRFDNRAFDNVVGRVDQFFGLKD